MKKIITITMLVLFAISFAPQNTMAQERRNEETVTLKVNMTCDMCVQKVKSNIPFVRGVRDLKVSLEKGECEVTYRTNRITTEQIIEAFEKLDFTVEEKTGEPDENGKEVNKVECVGHTH